MSDKDKDKELLAEACHALANHIETGSVTCSARDVEEMGWEAAKLLKVSIKTLGADSRAKVERLRALAVDVAACSGHTESDPRSHPCGR